MFYVRTIQILTMCTYFFMMYNSCILKILSQVDCCDFRSCNEINLIHIEFKTTVRLLRWSRCFDYVQTLPRTAFGGTSPKTLQLINLLQPINQEYVNGFWKLFSSDTRQEKLTHCYEWPKNIQKSNILNVTPNWTDAEYNMNQNDTTLQSNLMLV